MPLVRSGHSKAKLRRESPQLLSANKSDVKQLAVQSAAFAGRQRHFKHSVRHLSAHSLGLRPYTFLLPLGVLPRNPHENIVVRSSEILLPTFALAYVGRASSLDVCVLEVSVLPAYDSAYKRTVSQPAESFTVALPHYDRAHEDLQRTNVLQVDFAFACRRVQTQLMAEIILADSPCCIDLVAENQEGYFAEVFN